MVLIHAPQGLADGSDINLRQWDKGLPPPDWSGGEDAMLWVILVYKPSLHL